MVTQRPRRLRYASIKQLITRELLTKTIPECKQRSDLDQDEDQGQ
jgi:hypothetical protein